MEHHARDVITACSELNQAVIIILPIIHSKKKLVNLTRFGCFSCKSVCGKFCSIACPKGSSRKFNGLLYA